MSHSSTNSTSPSFNFQAFFDSALAKYTKRTGQNLDDHPLTASLNRCCSPDDVLSIFEKQAKAFDEFRNGEPKLLKWLRPIAFFLHELCTNETVTSSACILFPPAKAVMAGIGILLSSAKYVRSSYEALVDVFECIENFLRRLQIYTELPLTAAMTEVLGKIMVELLSVLSLATKQMNQGRFKKYAQKLLGERDIEAVLQRLDRLTMEEARATVTQTLDVVCGLVNNMEVVMEDGKVSTDEIREALVIMQGVAVKVNKIERDILQQRFRLWLSAVDLDPSTNHNNARKTHHKGTATWFIEGETFKEWKKTASILWIHGKPGSGKSVLCSTIIEDIQDLCQAGLATLAYFYFDFRNTVKQEAENLLSSILIQLSNESDRFTEVLSDLYSTHGNGFRQPSQHSLMQCLKNVLRLPRQGTIYIIIDALDESPNTGLTSPRAEVLGVVQDLVELALPHLHICVTSRPEMDIREALEPMTKHVSLHDQSGQNQDIVNYVISVVNSHAKMRKWRDEDRTLVINTLTERANGMFRWIYCQLDALSRCFPPSIRTALDNLPETLDETYERTLQGIDREKWDYAIRLFQCLVVSIRPLHVEELAEVLAVQPDDGNAISRFDAGWRPENAEEAVFSACSTLITVVKIDGEEIIQFSHFSVREYLTSNRIAETDRVSRFHVLLQPAHKFLARAALGVLHEIGGHIDKDNIKDFPLASYAAKHWVDHAQYEDVWSFIQDGMEFLFDEDRPHFAAWVWVHDLDRHPLRSHMSGEHPEQPDAGPLYYAALCGFHVMVERLLTRRHDVNAWGGQCATPLHASAKKGHLKVTQTLLKRGANVNARDDEDGTPLHKASQHGDPEIIRSLLKSGAEPNVENENSETPLFLASRKGRVQGVELLLKHGADPNHQDESGWTALRTAAANGQDDVAELLLRYGADRDLRDADSNTPLHMASFNGRAAAVQVLLEYGSDVDARDRRGGTPLQDAAQEGFLDVVQVLLDHGADPNAHKEDRWAALHVAAGNGHLDVVKLVLDHGGDPHAQNKEGETPLQLALRGNYLKVVQLLKERGCGEEVSPESDSAQAAGDQDQSMTDPIPSNANLKRKAPLSPPAQPPPAPALRRKGRNRTAQDP